MYYFFMEQLRELNVVDQAECKPNTSLQVVKIFPSNACIFNSSLISCAKDQSVFNMDNKQQT